MKHPITLLAALLLLLAVLSTAAPLAQQEQEQELQKAQRIVEPAGHMRVKRSLLSSVLWGSWGSNNDANRLSNGVFDLQYHIRNFDLDDDIHIA